MTRNLEITAFTLALLLWAPCGARAGDKVAPKGAVTKPAKLSVTKPAPGSTNPAAATETPKPPGKVVTPKKEPPVSRAYPKEVATSSTDVRPLSLRGAVKRALAKSPDITIASLKTEESLKRLEAEKRNILPKFTLSGNLMRWDSALQFSLGTPAVTTPPEDCPIGCLSFLGELFGSFDMGNIRDQYTQQYTVQVAQPITGAFAILQMIKARKIDIKVARLEERVSRHKVRYKTIMAYIQVLKAKEFLAIAQKSEQLLRRHLKQAMLFYKADVLAKSEILKLNSALGNAIQNRIQAKTGVTLSLSLLKMHMGDSSAATYNLTERFKEPTSLLAITEKEAYRIMEQNRPELKQLKQQTQMIRLSHKASRIMLLPSANIIGQFQHNEGMGTLQPKNSWFVGVNISWTWEWNKKHLEADLILSKIRQLEAATKQVRLGLRLNVQKNLLEVKSAWSKIGIARIALKEAEEALRLEQLRFGAQMKTSVSLLDAQTRLDGAHTALTSAIFDYYTSVAGLYEAMGVTSLKRSNITW